MVLMAFKYTYGEVVKEGYKNEYSAINTLFTPTGNVFNGQYLLLPKTKKLSRTHPVRERECKQSLVRCLPTKMFRTVY